MLRVCEVRVSLAPLPPCAVCKVGKPRFQIRALATGRVVNICSVKCVLSWCLGFSLGSVQGILQKLLKGMPK
jgi:hypothetical protein